MDFYGKMDEFKVITLNKEGKFQMRCYSVWYN